MASGSEVDLIVEVGRTLAGDGIANRIVSFPSWELFSSQPSKYQEEVLPDHIQTKVAVEAGARQGWERWTGDCGRIIGIDRFGESAPYKDVYAYFGLTVAKILETVKEALSANT